MEAHSLGIGDSFDEAFEELTAVALTALVGVFALALQDGEELRTGLEEAAPLADALEGAVEKSGPRAVTVGEQSAVVADRRCARAWSSKWSFAGEPVVLGFDRFGHLEVRVGDRLIRDAGIGQRHVHRAVPEQSSDRLEAHAPVDRLGGERVAQLVGMDVADPGPLGHAGHVAMDGAPVEGLAVVTLEEVARA